MSVEDSDRDPNEPQPVDPPDNSGGTAPTTSDDTVRPPLLEPPTPWE
jgi:hypothetical protein